MDIYIVEYTHCKYACNKSCLILLASCNLVACDNYIKIRINVTPNQPLLCNYCSIILVLVFHYNATPNIMSPYKHVKP